MAQALYDEHPIEEYLRVEVGEEEEEQLVPGTHASFDRVLFLDELPPLDLKWLAPIFERVSETVREERRKRRKGEAFAEVFKWRLVSSSLLATTHSGAGTSIGTTRSAFRPGSPDADTSSVKENGFNLSGVPGTWDNSEQYFDAQETQRPVEEAVELPSVPVLSASLLVLLRFPHVLLLVLVLCTPFWSPFLVEGRLWRLLIPEDHDRGESAEAEVDYEETLSTLDNLVSCYDNWEQITHLAIIHLSSSQFNSYAYSPDHFQSAFTQLANSSDTAALSEMLAQTLRTTASHTSTIRSLLSALARSPKEMRMLERMYAPISPNTVHPGSSWKVSETGGLKRTKSTASNSTVDEEEKEEGQRLSIELEEATSHLSPSPIQMRGKRPLSLAPSSPSMTTLSPGISPVSFESYSPARTPVSSPPSRARSPPPSRINARPQSLLLSSETSRGPSRHRLPYTSASISDIRSHAAIQPAPSLIPTRSGPSSTTDQRSLPSSPLTKFTTLPPRIGSPSNGGGTTRGRRRSLSSLRPWSASSTEVVAHPSPSQLPSRPASSPSSGVVAPPSTSHHHLHHHHHHHQYTSSQSHTRLTTHDLEPLTIPTSELMGIKKDAKAEIRHTSGCLLGLRFLSPTRGSPQPFNKKQYSVQHLWEVVEDYLWPMEMASDEFLSPFEPKRKTSDASFIREDEDEDEEDDALDNEIAYDPAYWEDVRSVLGLFKTALEDGVEKLKDAFPETIFPAMPSSAQDSVPDATLVTTPASAHPPPQELLDNSDVREEIGKTNDLLVFLKGGKAGQGAGFEGGFAPMPSQLARFVRHMETMQNALTEAQLALRETVLTLAAAPSPSSSSNTASRTAQEQEIKYDRLRSALGVALRECERGRTPLMEHLHPPNVGLGLRLGDTIPEELEDSDHLRESMPPLVHDDNDDHERSSTESMSMPPPHPGTIREGDSLATIVEGSQATDEPEPDAPTLQQLLERAFIPEGREQVFEGEPSNHQVDFERKRPSLSREERIRLVKARRATTDIVDSNGKLVKKKKSRPGLDVIQELKDVIWQVGERRRRMGRSATSPSTVSS